MAQRYAMQKDQPYEGVPDGQYKAEFTGMTEAETSNGPALRWSFKILEGPYKNRIASGLTGLIPTPKNQFGRFLSWISNSPVDLNVDVDIEDYIGDQYSIFIADKKGNVKMFSQID